ncbi:MAG: hypothetical protein MZU91_12870 [Desulfosudis oleivorans]|nr:hypothetical protein [Desulfosudis oleivorans]
MARARPVAARAAARPRRGRPHLPRPLHEPDHRHLLELPVPADHRLGIDPLRRPARHRQSVLAGLLLQQPAAHRRVDRLLGAGAHGGRDAHALLHGRPGRHRAGPRTRRAARRPCRPRQPDAQQLLSRALVRQPDPHLAGGAARLPVPGEGLARPGLSHRGRSAVGRRRAHRHPEPRSGAVRQRAREGGLRRRLRGRDRRHADREPVLVRRLPGLDLPDGWPRRHPHRRRAGLHADHPAHDRQDAPATGDVHRRRIGGALRLLPAADHGQDPLQAADGLSGAGHRQGSRPVLPALRPHHDDLGRGQVLPGLGRGLRVPDLPQEELLCRRVLRSAPSPRPPARSACSPPASRSPRRRAGPMPRTSSGHGKPTPSRKPIVSALNRCPRRRA